MVEHLGDRIRMHRARLRLSQGELARQVPISLTWMNAIECGHADPRGTHLKALAQALGVSADYLLGLTDDPTPLRTRPRPRKAAPVG
jgi:transcriptional regulator with XRE-family HTH domain